MPKNFVQSTLDLAAPPAGPAQDEVATFALLLRGLDWQTAAQIRDAHPDLCGTVSEANYRRQLRSWAEASRGYIISGNRGYRHILDATPEEITHAADRLRSQGASMIDRSIAIKRIAHQNLTRTPSK